MNARASRLLTLYGLFVLITGGLGLFVQSDEPSRTSYITVGLGVIMLVSGSSLHNAGASLARGAYAVLLLTISICSISAVRGWYDHVVGRPDFFLLSIMLSIAALFGLTLIKPSEQAWKRAQQFERIVDGDDSNS